MIALVGSANADATSTVGAGSQTPMHGLDVLEALSHEGLAPGKLAPGAHGVLVGRVWAYAPRGGGAGRDHAHAEADRSGDVRGDSDDRSKMMRDW